MEQLLPATGLSTGTFARMTGVTVTTLRSYDDRGLFSPAEVDAASRHRRYALRQVGRGRLLAALVATGMPVQGAAQVVRRGDRRAALAHLEGVRCWLEQGRDHLPLAGPDEALPVDVDRSEAWSAPVVGGVDLLGQVRAARARCATALGVLARDLTGWSPHEGLPTGPRVVLEAPAGAEEAAATGESGTAGAWAPRQVLLPLPAVVPPEAWDRLRPAFGLQSERRGRWWLTAPRPAEEWPELLRAGCTERAVLERVLREGGGVPVEQRLVWDRDLVAVSLLVRVHGGRPGR